MGGDRAPGVVLDGALAAAHRLGVGVALAGPADLLREELARREADAAVAIIVDAPDVVLMDEAPLTAMRRKPRSSIRVAAELVADGRASALFSAGHSGATYLAAHAAFGMLSGIERPALAVTVPTHTGTSILLDAGANLDCGPEHLVQFAHIGEAYARLSLAIDRPRVGLLSIGEEAGKGNELSREAHARLEHSEMAFIGNLEARDLFTGKADVIVCDGFTGNVALKVGEGLIEAVEEMLREELGAAFVSQIGALLTRRAFARFRQRVDYAEYGAAPLLGVAGLTLIGHGRSSARAVASGIALAARLAQANAIGKLGDELAHRAIG
jgi:glycerol-3-phosphate acyltransferase PlsX